MCRSQADSALLDAGYMTITILVSSELLHSLSVRSIYHSEPSVMWPAGAQLVCVYYTQMCFG